MTPAVRPSRYQQVLHAARTIFLVTAATLAVTEVILRIADFRILREAASERSLTYRHDVELGWTPVPNSSSTVTNARTFHVQHNRLGFRDSEPERDARPALLFLGDSFVWGVDAEADERFTDLLRRRLPGYRTVNAGISGYGTDQEYLLLRRIWPDLQPAVVALIFCTDNDRKDNRLNVRYDGYLKPYFVLAPDGTLLLRGQPVPYSRQVYIRENALVRHLWLARLAVTAYTEFRYPEQWRPDPTELLVGKVRQFVEANGGRLIVGLQSTDEKLVQYLRAEQIAYVTFDDAEAYGAAYGSHWTPEGHRTVAERLFQLLAEHHLVDTHK